MISSFGSGPRQPLTSRALFGPRTRVPDNQRRVTGSARRFSLRIGQSVPTPSRAVRVSSPVPATRDRKQASPEDQRRLSAPVGLSAPVSLSAQHNRNAPIGRNGLHSPSAQAGHASHHKYSVPAGQRRLHSHRAQASPSSSNPGAPALTRLPDQKAGTEATPGAANSWVQLVSESASDELLESADGSAFPEESSQAK